MMLQVRCHKARSLAGGQLRRRKELAHAFCSELAVLIVVEGLATELAKENGPVPADARTVLTRAVNQELCAVSCSHAKRQKRVKVQLSA